MLLNPRMRAILIVGVLSIAAAGAGFIMLGRAGSSADETPPAKPSTTAPRAAGSTAAGPRAPRARAAGAAAQPAAGDRLRLPAAIQRALSANRVVVVALFDPNAKIDDTAVREAGAGAQLAGTTFVPVDVTKSDVASLNARYGVIQDPAVLVLRPPGDLVVRIDGFADRDTVAQAAANAAQ